MNLEFCRWLIKKNYKNVGFKRPAVCAFKSIAISNYMPAVENSARTKCYTILTWLITDRKIVAETWFLLYSLGNTTKHSHGSLTDQCILNIYTASNLALQIKLLTLTSKDQEIRFLLGSHLWLNYKKIVRHPGCLHNSEWMILQMHHLLSN